MQRNLFTLLTAVLLAGILCACSSDEVWVVTRMKTVKEYGKSVDWLHAENKIVTARPLADGYYDLLIFSMDDPDNETYLTHKASGAPQKHNGNPAWYPSGDYIVFTAENEDVEAEYDSLAVPGRGVNCNLWLAARDGSTFRQLTFYETSYDADAPAVLHPQFSHDGTELFWSERVGAAVGTMWGQWALRVASVSDAGDGPQLQGEIQTLMPGDQNVFYESHAFSADGNQILFCGNLESGQDETGMDIYRLDLVSSLLSRMTATFADWDEHAHWSPDGQWIAWMSSTPLDVTYPENMGAHDWRYYLASELWIMGADGSGKQRLTYFNEPGHAHQRAQRTAVSDSAWSPDGQSLLVLLANSDGIGPESNTTSQLVQITISQ